VIFVSSFENGIKEGSLTSFEMTRIVIPNECEESFPSIFILCGRVQLMNHFVVNKNKLNVTMFHTKAEIRIIFSIFLEDHYDHC